jgi:4-aminobutyrate aminotransferase
MFAIEHYGVEPDILATAKGIASGMPLGVCCASADVMDWPPGAHASTFGGNPVSCAAAVATIKLLRDSLVANTADVGAFLLDGVRALKEKHPMIGDVRGKGLMIGIEYVTDKQTKSPAGEQRDRIVELAFEKGVLLLGCGPNSIRLCPPLIVTKQQADVALDILEECIVQVSVGKHKRPTWSDKAAS